MLVKFAHSVCAVLSRAGLLPFVSICPSGLGSMPNDRPLNPDLVANRWGAFWISNPTAPARSPSVFLFPQADFDRDCSGALLCSPLSCVERQPQLRSANHCCRYPTRAAPGFSRVRISPHLQGIHQLEASMPSRTGDIRVGYQFKDDHWTATVTLPPELNGEFVWKGKTSTLHSGSQTLNLP